jgi:glutaredoxin-related protein
LGSKAIVKDSQCKTLIKTVNVLKVENKELKTEVKSLVNKPADTILKTVYIKKGIFGGVDTLND